MPRNWKELSQQVTVSEQIRPEDVAHIAAAGFRTIVCNRPDGEEPGQPDWAEISEACRHNGVQARYVPMTDREPTDYAIDGFNRALAETQGKVFAYCRSGARSEVLWNAVMARRAGRAA